MANSRILPAAKIDIAEIYQYVAEESGVGIANLVAQDLAKTIDLIAFMPLASRVRAELDPELRARAGMDHARSFLVYYLILENEVHIVRVVHGAQHQADAFEA